MAGYVIPPAGVSAAGFFSPGVFVDPAKPPVILADDIDEQTGEVRSLMVGAHPVDAAVKEACRLWQGTGCAVMEAGNRLRDIRYGGPSAGRQIEDEVRRFLSTFVDRGDIEINTLLTEAGTAATGVDGGAAFVAYTNLRTGRAGQRARLGAA